MGLRDWLNGKLLLLVFNVLVAPGCRAQSDDAYNSARGIAWAQLEASDWSQGIPKADSIRVIELQQHQREFRLYSLSTFQGHSQPGVLVAEIRGSMVPLGGFSSPEVTRAVQLLGAPMDPSAQLAMARDLALCLDVNGARRIVYPFGERSASDSVIERWKGGKARFAPDTVVRKQDGGSLVSVQVLSRDRAGYRWQPFLYVFDFDNRGQLLAWYRNDFEGDFFFADGSLGN